MSGIAGIYFRDGRPTCESSIRKMIESMEHRGPDRESTWISGSVGLGHLLLFTTPESLSERLPVRSSGLAITADARVDNRRELLPFLRSSPGLGEQDSDSEFILAAYEKWGERCATKIIGDFAFCVRDERKDSIYCARDGSGDRPFYYYLCDRFFAFASEIKALTALDEIPRCLDETMVADYLIGMYDDREITFYRGIRRLPPGHWITVAKEFHRIECYWSLDPHREIRLNSVEDYGGAFRDIFTEAVRCRLRSASPVVSSLSGGLDSSSVTCVARNLLNESGMEPLRTLSLIYENVPECDERPYIDAVIHQGLVKTHFLPGVGLGNLPYIDCPERNHDDPFDAPNSQAEALASLAPLSGMRVGLDGFDGDTTVCHGYGYLIDLMRSGKWPTLLKETAMLAERQGYPRWLLLWRKAVKPQTPALVRRAWRFLTGRGERPWRTSLIRSDFAKRIGLKERFHFLQDHRLKPLTSSRLAHFYALTWGGIIHQMETSNKLAARHSLELRHPFRDTRLMEFCLALPAEQKLGDGWPRRVLRASMAGILPEEVRWRPNKTDFTSNLVRWALTLDRNLLDRLILGGAEAAADYVDLNALRLLYERFLISPMDVNLLDVWSVASLGQWLSRSCLRP